MGAVVRARKSTSLGDLLRQRFPALADGRLVYLDSAASAQKPETVIQAVAEFDRHHYANVHRGVYRQSYEATLLYEAVRDKTREFLGAGAREEILFTKGATEGVNLVAHSWGRRFLGPGDEIVVTLLEHHSNFVPWQIVAESTGARIRFVAPGEGGSFSLDAFRAELGPRTKIAAFTGLANAIGLELPVKAIVRECRARGVLTVVDAAQLVAHRALDVRALDVDFLVFSAHKLYGPTGVGVLYGKREYLEQMPPFLAGGDMIRSVSVAGTTYNDLPYKFEAGTPNISGVIGLGAAIDFISEVGLQAIEDHERDLIERLESILYNAPGVQVFGERGRHSGLVSFVVDGIHPHDLAHFLDGQDVAVRAGHHCAEPLMKHLGVAATTRVSLGAYNTCEDLDRFEAALRKALEFFA